MKHKILFLLAVITMLGAITACADSPSTPLPPVRIIRPTVAATRTPEELPRTAITVAPSATRTPKATREPTPTPMPSASPAPTSTQLTSQPIATSAANATVSKSPATGVATRRATSTPSPAAGADWYPCEQGQIKGNRNSAIYHVPGGDSYVKTRLNVQCFDTEALAQAAGFRRAKK